MSRKAYVVGVGMTKFTRPFSKEWDFADMAREAALKALADAKLSFASIDQACIGYVFGTTTLGQCAVYELGMTGIPVYNVNNACATGATALYLATQLVRGGMADCVLALGFDKMQKGAIDLASDQLSNPVHRHMKLIEEWQGNSEAPPVARLFGSAGREHMDRHGTTRGQFVRIAVKNHLHSVHNPYAQFQKEYSPTEIEQSPVIYDPLTKLQCCPTSDGAAAAIVACEGFIRKGGLASQAVEVCGIAMATDLPSSFNERSSIKLVGYDVSKKAAQAAYEQSGIGPEDIQVIELHDCFSVNELITYEALGLCPEGQGGALIESGATSYGGRWVVNPSGGLISKGHPLGATGLAQCAELVWQLRGQAERRQVTGVGAALQHNLGLGGACVVAIYRRAQTDGLATN